MNTSSSQTSDSWLQSATSYLKAADILTARLDCLVLLQDALRTDKASLLAHPELTLQGSCLKLLNRQLARRAQHEPLAYIRGKSEFYGHEFIVTKDTLQPRPESEPMITLLKELIHNSQFPHLLQDSPVTDEEIVIVDVGTGSGCLAITAKLETPHAKVHATEINAAALNIAKRNAKKLGADIHFYYGDLLKPIPSTAYHLPTIILANLPYVPDGHTINSAAMHEPEIAIFGGSDGLDLYRKLFSQISKLHHRLPYILTEALPFQHRRLELIANKSNYGLKLAQDFIQLYSAEP